MKAYSAAALLFLASLSGARAQYSPIGDWDCVISGARHGVAYMTFNSNMTLVVSQVAAPQGQPNSSDPRTVGDGGRVPSTNPPPIIIWGGEQMDGLWGFDSEGRVIGYFVEVAGSLTNQISFVGRVVPGKRITLNSSSEAGHATYQGAPAVLLTNLSGSYYATRRAPGQPLIVEFLSLSATDSLNHFYSVQGSGPGYTLDGTALLSGQKRFGLEAAIVYAGGTNSPIRGVQGSFNPRRMTGTLHGIEGTSTTNTTVSVTIAPE